MVLLDLHASFPHGVELTFIELARTDRVQDQVNLHACARALAERLRELFSDPARPVDVGFDVDGVLGLADVLQHGGEDLTSVAKSGHVVAGDQRGPVQGIRRARELRIVEAVKRGDRSVWPDVAGKEVDQNDPGAGGDRRREGRYPDRSYSASWLGVCHGRPFTDLLITRRF